MAAHRIDRINEEIKKELSVIVPRLKDPRIPSLLSVTAVEVTPDLKFAKVYVSLFGYENVKDALKGLNSSAGYIRKEIAGTLKLRSIPEFNFVFDNSIEHGLKISKILNHLDIKKDENQ